MTKSTSTPRRLIPMARKVPISRVRSRTAIHRVFMMPKAMITVRTKTRINEMESMAVNTHSMKETSSFQMVKSSFCPSNSAPKSLQISRKTAAGHGQEWDTLHR